MAGKKNDATQALDLLGDILADTEKQAEDERRGREEAERKKLDAAKRQVEEEEQKRREEAEARLRAEEERQKAALERRRMAQAAMSEDDDEDEAAAPAEAKKVEEEERSALPMLLAAIVFVALGVGGFLLYTEMTKEYVVTASFARSAPAVVDISNVDSSQEVAFLAKPVFEQPEEEVEAASPRRGNSSRRSRPAEPEPQGLQLRQGLSGR